MIVSERQAFVVSLFLALFLGSAATSHAAEAPLSNIEGLLEAQFPAIEALYKHLHANPELSFKEEQTSARLAQELAQSGFEATPSVGGWGVVGVLENGEGPAVLFRTDMDALPVREETGLPFASTAIGVDTSGNEVSVMHACGHDIHMASFVGTARLLSALREHWQGTLIMLAQPAEEMGAGALAMLNDGLYTRFPRPDYALALHVDASQPAGHIGYVPGYAMANVDSVDIHIRGIGGHGAYPHTAKDPVVIAAHTVIALQTIVSREVNPIDPAVVTVGSINGGTKHNIIPNEVKLQLTVRTYSDEVRDQVLATIERIAVGVAKTAGLPEDLLPTVTLRDEYTPATYNTPELVERTVTVFKEVFGADRVLKRKPVMGGEDFGRYGKQDPPVPAFMFRLGAVNPATHAASQHEGAPPLPSLHSSKFAPDHVPALRTGMKAATVAILDLMRQPE